MTSRFVDSLFSRQIHALKVLNTLLTSGKNQVGPDTLLKHGHGLSSPCWHSLQACAMQFCFERDKFASSYSYTVQAQQAQGSTMHFLLSKY